MKCQKQFYFKRFCLVQVQFFVHTQLNIKIVLFQAIQFNISILFSSIQPIDRTLSGLPLWVRVDSGAMAKRDTPHSPNSSMMVRVLANGPGDVGSIPGRTITKTQKYGT